MLRKLPFAKGLILSESMMSSDVGAELVVLVLVLVLTMYLVARGRRGQANHDQRGLPKELREAEVAYAEQTFRSTRRKLVARLDRAYRVDGVLKLVELKTRQRNIVHMADIIELSVQRVALRDATDEPVARDAWVLVQNATSGARRAHRVTLLETNEIDAMRERFVALSRGQIRDPQPAGLIRQCQSCGHRDRCLAKFGDCGRDA